MIQAVVNSIKVLPCILHIILVLVMLCFCRLYLRQEAYAIEDRFESSALQNFHLRLAIFWFSFNIFVK